jgi:hypothetical protein
VLAVSHAPTRRVDTAILPRLAAARKGGDGPKLDSIHQQRMLVALWALVSPAFQVQFEYLQINITSSIIGLS